MAMAAKRSNERRGLGGWKGRETGRRGLAASFACFILFFELLFFLLLFLSFWPSVLFLLYMVFGHSLLACRIFFKEGVVSPP